MTRDHDARLEAPMIAGRELGDGVGVFGCLDERGNVIVTEEEDGNIVNMVILKSDAFDDLVGFVARHRSGGLPAVAAVESKGGNMPKFKKLPEVVDAVQWHQGDPPLEGMRDAPSLGRYFTVSQGMIIGDPVNDGYWLVTDWKGNRRAYPPDLFEKMFEPVC